MLSPTRTEVQMFMKDLGKRLDLEGKDVLDIGTAGNQKGENDVWFGGPADSYTTMDMLKQYQPDIVADIIDAPEVDDESFDVIIMSQVIEHMYPPDLPKALAECYRILKPKGILIVDCPGITVQYHPEDGFGDYARYFPEAIIRMVQDAGIEVAGDEVKHTPNLTLVVGAKK